MRKGATSRLGCWSRPRGTTSAPVSAQCRYPSRWCRRRRAAARCAPAVPRRCARGGRARRLMPATACIAVVWSPRPKRIPPGASPGSPSRLRDARARPERPHVEGGAVRLAGAQAVAGDRRVDQARVAGAQRLVIQAGQGEAAGAQVGDEDVRPVGQPAHDRRACVAAPVDGQRALAAVVQIEGGGEIGEVFEGPAEGVGVEPLDLDHVRAPVGQDPRDGGARHPDPQLDDLDAVHDAHRRPPCAAPAAQPSKKRRGLSTVSCSQTAALTPRSRRPGRKRLWMNWMPSGFIGPHSLSRNAVGARAMPSG